MNINRDEGYWFEKLEENITSWKVEDRGEWNKEFVQENVILINACIWAMFPWEVRWLHDRRLHNKDLVTNIFPMNSSALSPHLTQGFLFRSRPAGLLLIPDCSTSKSCLYLLQVCWKCSKSPLMISCQWQSSLHKPIQPSLDPQHHSYLQPTICSSWSAAALGQFPDPEILLSRN